MKIISIYIFKQVGAYFLYITLFFTSLIWLMISLKYIEYVTSNGLSFLSFISLTSLLIPTVVPFLTPFSLALSCIFVYHKLSNDNELTIIKASGISKFQIIKPAIFVALLVTIFNLFLNLHISPTSKSIFKEQQKDLRENIARIAFKEGSFSTIFNDITIYVEEIIDDNNFSNIFVYDERNKLNPATYIAEEAELIQDETVNKVILKNGNRQFINTKDSQLNVISFETYEVNLDLLLKKDLSRIKEPEEMKLRELWDKKHIKSGKYDQNQLRSLRIEGHKRLINPIYCLIFTLISVTFILSDKMILKSVSKKNILIISTIFLIQILYLGLPNFLVKKIEFLYLIYFIPIFILFFLSLFNMNKNLKFNK